jgi:hypothetical protein
MRRVLPPFVLAIVATVGGANADARLEARQDAEVMRLLDAKGATLKWNHVPTGKTVRYGHAEVLVDAPLTKVQAAALDFAHYKDFHRKLATARVVAKEGANVDLYMKLPIKLGPVRIDQWEIMRFGPARQSATTMVVEGVGVQGNMKEGHIVIAARAIDDQHSLVKVDLLLVPKLPAPQALIDEELRDGAQDFVNGIRNTAQGDSHPVTEL